MRQAQQLGLVLSAWLPLAAQTFTYQQFFTPRPKQGSYTYANGINGRGTVVGYDTYSTDRGHSVVTRGFRRNPGGTFGDPIIDPGDKGNLTEAWGINDLGTIVGYYSGATRQLGFVENSGNFTTLDYYPGGHTWALGVNYRGDVAGAFGTQIPPEHGFIAVNGAATQIDVPGAVFTEAFGVAADGSVVGCTAKGIQSLGFVRSPDGRYRTIAVANANTTCARGIDNAAHSIVGYYVDQSGGFHGFIYDYLASKGTSADEFSIIPVTTIDYPGGAFDTVLEGINDGGQIVGFAQSQQGGLSPAFGFVGTPAQ